MAPAIMKLKAALFASWNEAGEGQRAFLTAHYRLPDHTGTGQEIAEAAGYGSYTNTNSIYGAFARRVAQKTGYQTQQWVMTITEAGGYSEAGQWKFKMKPAVVKAIESLGLIDPSHTRLAHKPKRSTVKPTSDEERKAQADDQAERELRQRLRSGSTELEQLIKARRGQGTYRKNLQMVESSCRVTGLTDSQHLRASHIKPWCVSSDRERLDGSNGLLLSPHIDHLFDNGYISFEASGALMVSKRLNPEIIERWGLDVARNVGTFSAQQRRYLAYHRTVVFKK